MIDERLNRLEATMAECVVVQVETLAAIRNLSDVLADFTNGLATRKLSIIDEEGALVATLEGRNGRGVLSLCGAGGEIITIGSP